MTASIPNPGDRIRLEHTPDEYNTTLGPGDTGTVTNITHVPPNHPHGDSFTQIWVDWDADSSLMLLAEIDRYTILD
jgi:hypothetical protein